MNGFLRSWKFCQVKREVGEAPRWRKTRMKRVWLWLVPGNICLRLLGTGYRVCGNDWAEYETRIFNLVHPGPDPAVIVGPTTVLLPHLEGIPLANLRGESLRQASIAAFEELGRFHRISPRMIHGDPHAGNFLHQAQEGRCRIIDFETAPLRSVSPELGRAMDYAILAKDLARMEPTLNSGEILNEWAAAYQLDDAHCPARKQMTSPPRRLRIYWWLLGLSPNLASATNDS
jgi:hypothetical protein